VGCGIGGGDVAAERGVDVLVEGLDVAECDGFTTTKESLDSLDTTTTASRIAIATAIAAAPPNAVTGLRCRGGTRSGSMTSSLSLCTDVGSSMA